jgi:CRISPR-associated protein Cmr6
MPDSDNIPLMYQAQVKGRSQIQYLEDLRDTDRTQQQAYDWVDEWVEGCDRRKVPQFGSHIKTKVCPFTWRMVTNSGQDGGVIRPVIGERGWAYFPGSSMKGAFLRACRKMATPEELLTYCGGIDAEGNLRPGLLRFHGGYPDTNEWLNDSLVDVVHPQEDWQVKDQANHSAFIQISLYKPKFVFGISSTKTVEPDEWTHIWEIWEAALGRGIGSRVSAGYGQTKSHGASKLLTFGLWGQGLCSQRIDKVGEFRPNMFKAALRGHTRRLFSGVVDDATADKLTRQLWGGFAGRDGSVVGLLGVAFSAPQLDVDIYQYGNNPMPIYETGDMALNILVMKDVSESEFKALKRFVSQLLKFSILLGGFGKSWRRVDHRLFSHLTHFPRYLTDAQRRNINPMIGCHWEFTEQSKALYVPASDALTSITIFLDKLQENLVNFPLLRRVQQRQEPQQNLRETWRKGNVEVWGRVARSAYDCLAIQWFHGAYSGAQSIKASELTGWSSDRDRDPRTMIGRIWHRMYPRYQRQGDEIVGTTGYVELLTIFPNRTGNPQEIEKTVNFLKFLKDSGDFIQLW